MTTFRITRHLAERMAERRITKTEVFAAIVAGRIVKTRTSETTGHPLATFETGKNGSRLHVVVDTKDGDILTAVYKTSSGRKEAW